MNELTSLFLKRRNYDQNFLDLINKPYHSLLKDVDTLAKALREVHNKQEQIVVLTDFDTDGIMSGVVAYAALAELGFHVSLYLPKPQEGYGFGVKDIDALMTQYPEAKALITADVGITAYEGVARAKEHGLKVFVTDHHKADVLPDADIVVNPTRPDDPYELKGICGAYVMYQVLEYYANLYGSYFQKEQINRLRVFAGIATISDAMPLEYQNRLLVRDALSICRYIYAEGSPQIVESLPGCVTYRKAFYGLYKILEFFVAEGKIGDISALREDFFGFYFSPMFNAVKRMEVSTDMAFGIFFGSTPEETLASLYALNEARKQMVADAYEAMLERDQPYAPHVYITDAAKGIMGLLAQRRLNDADLPVLVVAKDAMGSYRGSGRSPQWYPFISRTAGQSLFAAGHESAFGCYFETGHKLYDFVQFLEQDVKDALAEYEAKVKSGEIVVAEEHDFIISTLGDGDTVVDIPLLKGFLHDMDFLRPFGQAFPEPQLLLRFRASQGHWQTMGEKKDHLKIILSDGLILLAFNQAGFADQVNQKSAAIMECRGKLNLNIWNGEATVQFMGELSKKDILNGLA